MFFRLVQRGYRRHLFQQAKYSHCLAQTSSKQIQDEVSIWSLFKLSMYQTILNTPTDQSSSFRTLLAYAVSNAACGDTNQLNNLTSQIEQRFPSSISTLIEALAPYQAKLALDLAEKYNINSAMVVALLIYHSQFEKAEQLLQQINRANQEDWINLKLLSVHLQSQQSNVCAMNAINEIFHTHQLALIEKKDPLSTCNVKNIQAIPVQPSMRKQKSLISIIVTSFNAEQFIESTINSLLLQTYKNIEIIIIDDCSTDATWQIIQQLKAHDIRIKAFKQPINAGTYVAKNRALLMAKGEFVMCHDADDWSHPQRLELQITPLLQNKKLIATTSNWFRLSDTGEIYTRSIYPIARLNPSSPLFRRKKIMKQIGFWDSVRTGADSEFLNRIKLQFGEKSVKKFKLPLAIGAHHENSLMNAPDTGFVNQRIPQDRLEYWESWNRWHIQAIQHSQNLFIKPFLQSSERKFSAPKALLIENQVLNAYSKSFS